MEKHQTLVSDDYRTSQRKMQYGQAEKYETVLCENSITFPFSDSIIFSCYSKGMGGLA